MRSTGCAHIGEKAPDFHCEAIINGVRKGVSLSTYIRPRDEISNSESLSPWLVILFTSTASRFVNPAEIAAFADDLAKFRSRNCNIVIVSVDAKRSLWYWESIPRCDGGVGHVEVPLLFDTKGSVGKAYGILAQDHGPDLRGMFILDDKGVVQQITLSSGTIDFSVSETLRLLAAYQSLRKLDISAEWDEEMTSDASTAGKKGVEESIIPRKISLFALKNIWIKARRRVRLLTLT